MIATRKKAGILLIPQASKSRVEQQPCSLRTQQVRRIALLPGSNPQAIQLPIIPLLCKSCTVGTSVAAPFCQRNELCFCAVYEFCQRNVLCMNYACTVYEFCQRSELCLHCVCHTNVPMLHHSCSMVCLPLVIQAEDRKLCPCSMIHSTNIPPKGALPCTQFRQVKRSAMHTLRNATVLKKGAFMTARAKHWVSTAHGT